MSTNREKETDIFSCKFHEVDIEELQFRDEIGWTGYTGEINAELSL